MNTRHEEYESMPGGLPFVLHTGIRRNGFLSSKQNNWHENLELQLITGGEGTVLLDGEKLDVSENDIVVVNSNVLHYTGSDIGMTYSCIIIGTELCRRVGVDPGSIRFESRIKSEKLIQLFKRLIFLYENISEPYRELKLNIAVLEMLDELIDRYRIERSVRVQDAKILETVRCAVTYIRKFYYRRITLDEIAKAMMCDKYALCREFKKLTGQTIIENLNKYRCIKATELLNAGHSVAHTAEACGFYNVSFFTKIFKRYMGRLPSEQKKQARL